MSLLERLPYIRQLWAMALPGVEQPSDEFLVKWSFDYTDKELEYAIIRTSKKFHHQTVEPAVLHRYCAGVLRNEKEKAARKSSTLHKSSEAATVSERSR